MKRHALIDKDGNVINVIIYDGVAKYKLDNDIQLIDINDPKDKYFEITDKLKDGKFDKIPKEIIP